MKRLLFSLGVLGVIGTGLSLGAQFQASSSIDFTPTPIPPSAPHWRHHRDHNHYLPTLVGMAPPTPTNTPSPTATPSD